MTTEQKTAGSSLRVHRWVFWPAALIIIIFVAFAMIAPDIAEALFASIQSKIIGYFNWYYVLIATAFVGFSLWLGFGKFGDIKLGKDEDEPEFSLGSWFALLFAAGMGIGLVFYGVSEPLSHFASPKPGVSGTPAELAQIAQSQTILHWGVHAWSIYVVIGLALAYAIHRRGRPISIRWTLEPLLGRRVHGGLGNLIDVIALVGTIFGVATSLGFGVLQISAGLQSVGLIEESKLLDLIIIAVVTAMVLFSVLSGVGKGMKWLSNTNLILAGVFVMFLLVVGPSQFLLRNVVQSTGNYLQTFFAMSFNVSAFTGEAGEAWQGTWTTFYWGWWMSWAPFVGIFIARISRGRTVRQFVAGVILVPTAVTILWFSVLGGTAIYGQLQGTGNLVGPDGTVDTAGALFAMLDQLPAGSVLTVGAILMIVIFFVTSADSGALVMGMIATGGEVEPKNWIRIFFTLSTSLLAASLLLSGGLEALKTAAIIIALPFSVVLILICWATYRAFSREVRVYEKARRMAFVDHIGDFYGLEVEAANQDSQLLDLRRFTARLRRAVPSAQRLHGPQTRLKSNPPPESHVEESKTE
ncbi:BCCT family transporter [Paeniglutamicibacter kerguelensis]|uniref:Choline/glycine/proline betaine transport protein n=1 Tax=Paeniglutamicibacter kerguelensis TaxID=254788 RepID=A0ABS4XJE0_9MICC|nr:BCCT family transporter [Paeniglutamicibacter kerguelensis]MBP2388581.1 choline/glycine/proline betaine transport protein [Paeniglutamicibacter kerguelensis]